MILTVAAAFVLALLLVAPPLGWLVVAMRRRHQAMETERNFWASQERNFSTGHETCVELDIVEERMKRENGA